VEAVWHYLAPAIYTAGLRLSTRCPFASQTRGRLTGQSSWTTVLTGAGRFTHIDSLLVARLGVGLIASEH